MSAYQIDPRHSGVYFQVRHMGIALVRGEFGKVTGTIEFDPANPGASRLEISIDATTVYSRDPHRDGFIKAPDILDTEHFPSITFKSTAVAKDGAGYEVVGDLTFRGVRQAVTLKVSHVSDEITDPWSNKRRGATATARISRKAFGMGWTVDIPGVGPMVSDEVDISMDIEFTRAA